MFIEIQTHTGADSVVNWLRNQKLTEGRDFLRGFHSFILHPNQPACILVPLLSRRAIKIVEAAAA